MMDRLLAGDTLKGKPAKRGVLRYDLRDVREPGHPSNVFSLVDTKGLPPDDYRARLIDGGFDDKCVRTLDRVFALLLLNTGIKTVA